MALWQAECWLGSSGGMQTLQCSANTSSGAEQQFKRIYGAEKVSNVKMIKSDARIQNEKLYGEDHASSGNAILLGLIVLLVIIVTYLPIFTSIAGGAFGAWASGKIMGKNLSDAMDEDKEKIVGLILLTTLVFGGVGYVKGTEWQKELNTQSVPQNVTGGNSERKSLN